MIAALYVQKSGVYYGLPDVDPWDEARDARKYAGPWPVVAHPPCARWSMLAKLVQSLGGKRLGDDDGCFAAALAAVRLYGGVIEHPAWSHAFGRHGLATPPRGHWQRTICGGWSTEVSQSTYGHQATKDTWLYCFGLVPPSLDWSRAPATHCVTCGPRCTLPPMKKSERSRTPIPFRDLLLDIARAATK